MRSTDGKSIKLPRQRLSIPALKVPCTLMRVPTF